MFRSADPPGNRLHAWSEQQTALAEFGLVARGLRAPIAKVLEALPGRDELLLRAAVGVPPEIATTERIGVVISSWRTLRIVLPSGLMSANTGVKQNALLSMVAALLPPNGEDMMKIRSTGSHRSPGDKGQRRPIENVLSSRHQGSGIGLFISKSLPSGWYLFDGETIIWLSRFNNTR